LVMTRGTFGNVRVKNQLAPGTEGGFTTDFTDGVIKSIYEASCNYKEANIPLVVLTGKDYGMGSSRDWAVPLEFLAGQTAASLGLDGTETFTISINESVQPRDEISVVATKEDGTDVTFQTRCRIDTPVEVEYYRNGGILHAVLRKMARS